MGRLIGILLAAASTGLISFGLVSAQPAELDSRFHGAIRSILKTYELHGEKTALERARLYGLRPHTLQGKQLIPLVIRPAAGTPVRSFDSRWLVQHGMTVDAVSNAGIRVLVPVSRAAELAGDPQIGSVGLPLRPHPFACSWGLGSYVAEAVAHTGADSFQMRNITGKNVKVAVVDAGFIGLDSAIAHGELPVSTKRIVLPGTGYSSIQAVTNHGTAVAEQVMDMAPGASLFCILITDEVDMANAADTLKARGIRIANHSMGWFGASYYNDSGPIDKIVNDSHDQDSVFWAVAAGNMAQRHWRGPWSDPEANNWLNFRGSEEAIRITDAKRRDTVTLWLSWNQYSSTSGPATDLNAYVYNKNGAAVDSSVGVQSTTTGTPEEMITFTYDSVLAPYTVKAKRRSGPTANLDVTIFCDNAELTFASDGSYAGPGSSMVEPADAHGAFSVGAVDKSVYDGTGPAIEYFSSRGPTNDGRHKPELAAPDRTSCYTYRGTAAGTSFSSPVTAGAAALLAERYPGISMNRIADTLRALGRDVGPAGWDSAFGSGLLRLKIQAAPPVLAAPANAATGQPIAPGPALSWGTVGGSPSYRLTLSTSSAFSSTVTDQTVGSSSASPGSLTGGTTYFWRVQAVYSDCFSGAWSAAWSFSTVVTGTVIPLAVNWNMKSLNIHPVDSSTGAIFANPKGFLFVKNGAGQAYCPSMGIDKIGALHTGLGYQIYTSAADTIRVPGTAVNTATTPITLASQGWALVAYLPQKNLPIVTALASINSALTLVKNNDGQVYWPEELIDQIDTMRVGEGYQMITKADAVLTYPSASAKGRSELYGSLLHLPPPRHFLLHGTTGNNASVLIGSLRLGSIAAHDNCEVAAFDGSGACVGAGTVMSGRTAFALWGDDPQTPAKDGCSPGERVGFRLWDGSRELPLEFDAGTTAEGYRVDGIMLGRAAVAEKLLIRGFDLTVAPNPFRGRVRLAFEVPSLHGSPQQVEIAVYDMRGSLVRRLFKGDCAPGRHILTFGGLSRDNASGAAVYLVRMKAPGFEKELKLIELH